MWRAILLDGSLNRSCSKLRIKTDITKIIYSSIGYLELETLSEKKWKRHTECSVITSKKSSTIRLWIC